MAKGRPRKFDENEVLDTAIRLFRRDGYDSVGIAELRRETGLASQSLYNTFGDKAGLFERAMQRYGETANDPIIHAIESEPDPAEALRKFARAWKRHAGAGCDGGCLFTQVMASADEDRERTDAEIARAFSKRLRSAIHARAKEAAELDLLPAEIDPAHLADGLLTLAFGIAVIGRGGMPASMINNAVAQALAMIDGSDDSRGAR